LARQQRDASHSVVPGSAAGLPYLPISKVFHASVAIKVGWARVHNLVMPTDAAFHEACARAKRGLQAA
ncbi:hypothetical protein HaLaN_15099, partial [Haematococcus lacustris]